MKTGRQRKKRRQMRKERIRAWSSLLLDGAIDGLNSYHHFVCTTLEGDEPMKLGMVIRNQFKCQSSNKNPLP